MLKNESIIFENRQSVNNQYREAAFIKHEIRDEKVGILAMHKGNLYTCSNYDTLSFRT